MSAVRTLLVCWDPVLEEDPVAYLSLVLSLHERSMLRYSKCCKASVGLFCVAKKSGQLRLIVDCRPLNQLLKSPPKRR